MEQKQNGSSNHSDTHIDKHMDNFVMQQMLVFISTYNRFSGDGPFELHFEYNCDLPLALFVGKIEEADCTTPFVCTRAWMMHQLQVCGQHNCS